MEPQKPTTCLILTNQSTTTLLLKELVVSWSGQSLEIYTEPFTLAPGQSVRVIPPTVAPSECQSGSENVIPFRRKQRESIL